jgi:hypothetical protein
MWVIGILKIVGVVQAGLEHLRLWPGSPAHLVRLPNRAAALPQQHSRAAALVDLAGALALALLQHPRQQLAQATATCGKCASDCPPQRQLDEKGHFFCAER